MSTGDYCYLMDSVNQNAMTMEGFSKPGTSKLAIPPNFLLVTSSSKKRGMGLFLQVPLILTCNFVFIFYLVSMDPTERVDHK